MLPLQKVGSLAFLVAGIRIFTVLKHEEAGRVIFPVLKVSLVFFRLAIELVVDLPQVLLDRLVHSLCGETRVPPLVFLV